METAVLRFRDADGSDTELLALGAFETLVLQSDVRLVCRLTMVHTITDTTCYILCRRVWWCRGYCSK
jgi:hypothetical protein